MKPTSKVPAVLDELGSLWLVEPGDPGYTALKAAKALRFKSPVYPHEVLMGRTPDQPHWDEFAELVDAKGLEVEELRRIYVSNKIREHLRKAWNTKG